MTFPASIFALIFPSTFHEHGSQNGSKKYPGKSGEIKVQRPFWRPFRDPLFYVDSSTLRAPADPFARTAVYSQRSLLAAQFSRSAVSVLPSKPGRAQGWAKGPMQKAQGQRAQGTKGPFGPFGPRGPSGPWAPSGCAYTQQMLSLTE